MGEHKFDYAMYAARKKAIEELEKSQAGSASSVKNLGDRLDKVEYVLGLRKAEVK